MKKLRLEEAKARILTLYKELINRHLILGYKFELIELPVKPNCNHVYYHLRFTKEQEDCKYYKVMIDLEKYYTLDFSLDDETNNLFIN